MSNLTRPSEFFGPDCWTHWPFFMNEIVRRCSQAWLFVASSFAAMPSGTVQVGLATS